MGCFLGCFGSSKRRKQSRKRNDSSSKPQQPCASSVQDHSKPLLNPSSQLKDKSEDQLSVSTRRKVTFDSNVKTYEPVLLDEAVDGGKVEALATKPTQSKSSSSEDSSVTSTGSYPSNLRYQNCRDSDDEVDDDELGYGASDLSDEEDDEGDIREEYGDGFEEDGMAYSKGEEKVENAIQTCDGDDVKSIGLNPNARDRSVYVHPVLNPVENLTQWKVVKSKRTPPLRSQKENYLSSNHESRIAFGTAEPSTKDKELAFSFNSDSDTSRKVNQDIPVDASLSNWLISPETKPVSKAGSVPSCAVTPDRTTSQGSTSVISHDYEDRPILGALTVEEIKQFSATSSPRKSPSRSPDEMPIIGTVGTYWNFTGTAEDSGSVSSFKGVPNTTSKYREDKRVNWHSTPFEKRLEKALNTGAAEDASTCVPHVF